MIRKRDQGKMAENASLGRATRRALQTRQRLKEASLALFIESGVGNTAIEEITERADVGKGTFYRHFTNKEALAAALVEDAVDHLLERMSEAEKECRSLDEAIERLIQAHSEFFQKYPNEFLLLFQERVFPQLQRDSSEEPDASYLNYLEGIRREVARFIPRPVAPLRIRRLACAIAGFVSGLFSFAVNGMAPEEVEKSGEPLRRAFVATSSAFLLEGEIEEILNLNGD